MVHTRIRWSRNDLEFKSRQQFVSIFTSLMVTIKNSCVAFNNIFNLRFDSLPTRNTRDLQIRLRLRVRVRVFQCVPGAHARLRATVTSTLSVVKISSPS